jgi:hypothetical protein
LRERGAAQQQCGQDAGSGWHGFVQSKL